MVSAARQRGTRADPERFSQPTNCVVAGPEGRGGTAAMKRSTLRFCMQKLGASEQRVPAVDRADQPNSERSNTAG